MHTDMLPVAAFFQRIVQRTPKDGEDICRRHFFLLLQIIQHLGGRRNQAVIDLIAYDFRRVEQLSRLRLRNNIVFIQKISSGQPITGYALFIKFRCNFYIFPIFHRFFLFYMYLKQSRTFLSLNILTGFPYTVKAIGRIPLKNDNTKRQPG